MSAILVAILTGVTCAVLRSVGVRRVWPIALVVELFVLAWIFVPQTMLGIIPTPSSLAELGSMLGRAQDIMVEEAAPGCPRRADHPGDRGSVRAPRDHR